MDATTMNETGAAGLPATGTSAAETADAPTPVITALKDVGWCSLGLVALAVEGTGRLISSATKRGKDLAPSVAKSFKTAGTNVEEALGGAGSGLKRVGRVVGKRAEAVEHAMDERIAAVVERAGAPVMVEMGELKARVEELSKKIDHLQTRREKPEKPSH